MSGLKDYKVKNKLRIHATEASKTALAKVKEAGGEILIENNVKKEWLNSPREDFQEQDVNKPLNIIKKILEYRDKLTKLEEGFH